MHWGLNNEQIQACLALTDLTVWWGTSAKYTSKCEESVVTRGAI